MYIYIYINSSNMKRISIYLGLFLFILSAKNKESKDRPNALKELIGKLSSIYLYENST